MEDITLILEITFKIERQLVWMTLDICGSQPDPALQCHIRS